MATSRSLRETIGDVTECSICTESMVDPRLLPCIHTFCFKCLDQLWKDKQPGVTVPCPLCRGDVVIPVEGVSGLPKNFFVKKLVEAQKLSEPGNKVVNCDICLKQAGHDGTASASEMFCVECKQHMCKKCSKFHNALSITSTHHVIPTGSKLTVTEELISFPEARCQSHIGKDIEIYCMECEAAVCTICFITQHNGHKCSDMKQVADDLKKQIKSDIEKAQNIAVEVNTKSKHLEKSLAGFNFSVEKTQLQIVKVGEDMKQLIDKHVQDLLQEVRDEKTKKIKQFKCVEEELLIQKLSIESFIKYSEKILEKAAPTDVASAAKGLSVRVENLKFQFQEVPRVGSLEMSFTQNDSLISAADKNDKSLFGKISIREIISARRGHLKFSCNKNPTRVASIPLSGSVSGIAMLEDRLFIVEFSSPNVTEFDSNTYGLKSKFTVPGLSSAWDMVANNKVLFVSEHTRNTIHRIQLPEKLITAFTSGGTINSLSINKHGNVLVTSNSAKKVFEYTDTGTLLRDIPLPIEVDCPFRAVQLDNNQFLVSLGGKNDRVCLIDYNAKLFKRYGGKWGSCRLYSPHRFVVDQNGFILVASYGAHRVVLLDAQLEFVKNLIPTSFGITDIFAIALDENTGKLYVSNDKGITVFQLQN